MFLKQGSTASDIFNQPEQDSSFLGLAGDFGSDLLMLAPRIAEGIYDDTIGALIGDTDRASLFGQNRTIAGGVLQGIGEFATAFVPASAALRGVGVFSKAASAARVARGAKAAETLAQAGRGALAGLVADATVFGGKEERLSNLIELVPELSNPVSQYLAADPDDTELEGRFKNALEGLMIGGLTEPLFQAIKGIKLSKAGRDATREAQILSDARVIDDIQETLDGDIAGAVQERARVRAEVGDMPSPTPESRNLADRIIDAVGAGADAIDTPDIELIRRFSDRVSSLIHDSFRIEFSREAGAESSFDFGKRVVTITEEAVRSGRLARDVIHEVYHAAQNFIDPKVRTQLSEQYREALNMAKEADPDLVNRLDPAHPERLLPSDLALQNEDEWVAEILTARTLADLAHPPRGEAAGFLGKMRVMVQDMLDVFRGFWGERPVQKALDQIRTGSKGFQLIAEDVDRFRYSRAVGETGGQFIERIQEDFSKTLLEGIDFKDSPEAVSRELRRRIGGPDLRRQLLNFRQGLDSEMDAYTLASVLTKAFRKQFQKIAQTDPQTLAQFANDAHAEVARLVNASGIDDRKMLAQAARMANDDSQLLAEIAARASARKMIAAHLLTDLSDKLRATKTQVLSDEEIADLVGEIRSVSTFLAAAKGNATALGRALKRQDIRQIDASDLLVRTKGSKPIPPAARKGAPKQGKFGSRSAEFTELPDPLRESEIRSVIEDLGGSEKAKQFIDRLRLVMGNDEHAFGKLAETADPDDLLDMMSKAGKILVEQERARGMDLFFDYWYFSLLSGVSTQVVNFVSTGLRTLYHPVEAMIGGATMAAIGKVAGRESLRDAGFEAMRSSLDFASGLVHSWEMSMNYAKLAMRENRGFLDPEFGTNDLARQSPWASANLAKFENFPQPLIASGDTIARVLSLPSRALKGSDELWKQMNYRAYLWADGARKARRQAAEAGKSLTKEELHEQILAHQDQFLSGGAAKVREKIYKTFEAKILQKRPQLRDKPEDLHALTLRWARDYINKNPDIAPTAQYALDLARENTFTAPFKDDFYGKVGIEATRVVRNIPAFRLVVPFIRTPLNIFSQGIDRFAFSGRNLNRAASAIINALDRSGAGLTAKANKFPRLVAGLEESKRVLLDGSPEARAQEFGKLSLSLLTTFSVAYMASAGIITGGGPRDARSRQTLLDAGWQPYSINLGGKSFSFARLEPFAAMIGMIADIVEYDRQTQEEETDDGVSTALTGQAILHDPTNLMIGSMIAVLKQMTDKTFLQGITNFVDALKNPDRYVTSLAGNYTASLSPNILKTARDTIVPAFDSNPEVAELRTYLDRALDKVPGYSQIRDLPPRRNFLGEPKERYSSRMEGWARGLLGFEFSTVSDDTIFNEIRDLGITISPPKSTRNGIELHDIEVAGTTAYDRWGQLWGETKINGRTMRQELVRLIRSGAYQRMSPISSFDVESPRRQAIRSVVVRYQRAAYRKLLSESPELRLAERQFFNKRRLASLGISSE